MNLRKPLWPALIGALIFPGGIFSSHGGILKTYAYKTVDGKNLNLTVALPPDWKASDKRPAIVFFHGGGWTGGEPTVFNRQSAYFSTRGVVCIQPQYRLLDKKSDDPPAVCIQDARSAMRWIRSHAAELGIDPDRIAAGGASAGGHLAACLGLMDNFDDPQDDLAISPKPQALLLYNPVLHNGPGEWGYGFKRTGDRYLEFSPFFHVSKFAPPMLILTGTQDHLVAHAMILDFQEKLKAIGLRCDVVSYDGQDHSFFRWSNEQGKYFYLTTKAVDEFLESLGWVAGVPAITQEQNLTKPQPE